MCGPLGGYLMVYTGWELMAKSLLWDESHPGGLQSESARSPLHTGLAADVGEVAQLPAFLGPT
jgi:hypothetical protein